MTPLQPIARILNNSRYCTIMRENPVLILQPPYKRMNINIANVSPRGPAHVANNNPAPNSLDHEPSYRTLRSRSWLLNKPSKTPIQVPGNTPAITVNPAFFLKLRQVKLTLTTLLDDNPKSSHIPSHHWK